jgi:hypothetical protein
MLPQDQLLTAPSARMVQRQKTAARFSISVQRIVGRSLRKLNQLVISGAKTDALSVLYLGPWVKLGLADKLSHRLLAFVLDHINGCGVDGHRVSGRNYADILHDSGHIRPVETIAFIGDRNKKIEERRPALLTLQRAESVFGHILLQDFVFSTPIIRNGIEPAYRHALSTADALVGLDIGLFLSQGNGTRRAVLDTFAAARAAILDFGLQGGVLSHLAFSAGTAHSQCLQGGGGTGGHMPGKMSDGKY